MADIWRAWTAHGRCMFAFAAMLGALAGCGGGGSPVAPDARAPDAPSDLTLNLGNSVLSLGWNAPMDDGGDAIDGYEVTVDPPVAAASISINGTRALVRELTQGVNYTVAVRARNRKGLGQPASLSATPRAADPDSYVPLTIQGDHSPSGIFDPSIVKQSSGDLWLSYSSVDYHTDANGQLVQDVSIRLARSTDGGASFDYRRTIATPAEGTVTDTDPAHSACGAATCAGRWEYETSWIIEDSTDPDPNRRFKLFAHKYFLVPGGIAPTLYHLGSIVMWTAATPDRSWSQETSLLGWFLTPPELAPLRTVNALHADLASCIAVAEGSAVVRNGNIDLVFACTYPGGDPLPQKVVMLRSSDHANSFQYVGTLLAPSDAAPIGASYFSAPALVTSPGTAPVLLATPAFGGIYAGCVAFAFADPDAGTLFRANGLPVGLLYTPPLPDHIGGACTYDRKLSGRGLLQSDAAAGVTAVQTQFRILTTRSALQP